MVFVLKLVLIILLNKTYALLTQDSEIVLLPAWNPTEAKEISLTLKIFEKLIQLNLHKNNQFVLPAFKIWEYNANGVTKKLSKLKTSNSCFYVHEDDVSSAAINICQKHGLEGLIFVENDILEIRPLWNMFAPLPFIDNSCVRQQINQSFGTPHFVKKLQRHFAGSDLYNSYEIRSKRLSIEQIEKYTIELFVIVDVTTRDTFMSLFNHTISYIYNLIHTYVDNMQNFFSRPSLGVNIDIVLKRIHIMREPLPNFSRDHEESKTLLYAFCKFITPFNPPNNDDPDHWDIALYVSGINLYALKKTRGLRYTYKDYGVSGKSYLDGACKPNCSCAIVELLRRDVDSSGSISKISSLNAVHEIGILLGLREDRNENRFNSYIMSTERPYRGNVIWSPESQNMIKEQLKTKFCLQDHQPKKSEVEKSDNDDIEERKEEETERYTIKLGVFVDVTAYRTFLPFFNNHISYIYSLMRTYVNHMQTYFYHPSLGVYINIVLINVHIMREPLPNFLYDGNIESLLNSFCNFAITLNPPNNNPKHWDIALHVSDKDFHTQDYKFEIAGKSHPDGVCQQNLSCAVVEFLRNQLNPPRKFYYSHQGIIEASLNAVHQIGILLGLREDPYKARPNSYIMSTKRPFRGDVTWSPESRNIIKKQLKTKSCLQDYQPKKDEIEKYDDDDILSTFAFDDSHYGNYPGRKQTAKAQCELFLRDKNANVVTLHDICKNLQCETPRKNKFYFAGSALNGTHCAFRKECYGGECVPIIEPPYNFKYCEVDRWSEWKEDSCKSDCLVKSKGVQVKRRSCKHRTKRAVDCSGPYYDVNLCDDFLRCIEKRKSIAEFVTIKCTEFNKVAKKVDTVEMPTEKFQFNHDIEKPWKACTVYCRQKETFDWDASRQEMLDHGINPYFPDGTWCHNENGTNYYCRQHYCLSEFVSSVNANF